MPWYRLTLFLPGVSSVSTKWFRVRKYSKLIEYWIRKYSFRIKVNFRIFSNIRFLEFFEIFRIIFENFRIFFEKLEYFVFSNIPSFRIFRIFRVFEYFEFSNISSFRIFRIFRYFRIFLIFRIFRVCMKNWVLQIFQSQNYSIIRDFFFSPILLIK